MSLGHKELKPVTNNPISSGIQLLYYVRKLPRQINKSPGQITLIARADYKYFFLHVLNTLPYNSSMLRGFLRVTDIHFIQRTMLEKQNYLHTAFWCFTPLVQAHWPYMQMLPLISSWMLFHTSPSYFKWSLVGGMYVWSAIPRLGKYNPLRQSIHRRPIPANTQDAVLFKPLRRYKLVITFFRCGGCPRWLLGPFTPSVYESS